MKNKNLNVLSVGFKLYGTAYISVIFIFPKLGLNFPFVFLAKATQGPSPFPEKKKKAVREKRNLKLTNSSYN